jgi:hypothetical protein
MRLQIAALANELDYVDQLDGRSVSHYLVPDHRTNQLSSLQLTKIKGIWFYRWAALLPSVITGPSLQLVHICSTCFCAESSQ